MVHLPGGVLATKQEIRPYPTRTNQIPRHVPPPHWASHPWVLFLAAGLLPYGTLFVELYFAMSSIWQVCSSACLFLELFNNIEPAHHTSAYSHITDQPHMGTWQA